jgi:hypothetical protein
MALFVLGGCKTDLPTTEAGPDVSGTWSGSTAQATLSMMLGPSSCTSGSGYQYTCSGYLTGGSYSDTARSLRGAFALGAGEGGYILVPPAGVNPSTAPLTGWFLGAETVDSTNALISIEFINGTFSSSTSVAGTAVFTNSANVGGFSDSVPMVLTRQ